MSVFVKRTDTHIRIHSCDGGDWGGEANIVLVSFSNNFGGI